MKSKKHQEDAFRIIDYYKSHNLDRKSTVNHFFEEGLNKTFIYNVIKRFINDGRIEYNLKSGPKRTALSENNKNKIKRKFISNPSISNRKVATELGINEKQVRIAKKEMNIVSKKKVLSPKYTKNQPERCKKNAWKLYKLSLTGKMFVLDDETYVHQDPSQVPGVDYYNEIEGVPVDLNHKLKPKVKFSKRYLVWQAIASNGQVSDAFIHTGTINGQIYKKECLKRLISFIDQLGNKEDIIFWPDMATSHYQKDVIECLESNEIKYVKKADNTPNCPQLRPIERYWALCKAKYKRLSTVSKDIGMFKRRWSRISKEIACNSGKKLFRNFTKKLCNVGKNGVNSVPN